MARPQTTPQDLSNKLNTLESAIVNAEESAEDARWQQASIVMQMIDGGVQQKDIAAGWYNGRTGKPYTKAHVTFVKRVCERFTAVNPRPDWTTAYYTVQQGADELVEPEQRQKEWTQAHEARAPKSEETAEKLVQNLLKESPGVVETVYHGLREGREDRYVEPVDRERRRKEAEAFAKDRGEPIVTAFSKSNAVLYLEQALDELREASSIDGGTHDRMLILLDEIRTEVEVKRAMEGVR